LKIGNLGSSVSTATGLRMNDRGSVPYRSKRIFLFATSSRPALRPIHPPI